MGIDVPLSAPIERDPSPDMLAQAVQQADNAVVITDDGWRVIYVNPAFTQRFGYTLAELHGQQAYAQIAPLWQRGLVMARRQAVESGQPQRSEELVYGKDGQRFWASITTAPVCDEHGVLQHTASVFADITDAKMHEVVQHKVLEAMVQEAPLVDVMALLCREVERIAPEVVASVIALDTRGKPTTIAAPSLPGETTRAIDSAHAWPTDMLTPCPAKQQRVTHLDSDPAWEPYRSQLLALGLRACWSTPILTKDGRIVGVLAFYLPEVQGPDAFLARLVSVSSHLCALALEREFAQARIRELVFYDPLTGLPNRTLLQARAEQAISDSMRRQACLAVLFVDLDRFKQINDTLGHPAGDALLCTIAGRLRDAVGGDGIVARLSGDEFVIVRPDTDSTQATALAESVHAQVCTPFMLADLQVTPSASIGISLLPNDGNDMDTLVRRADMAMYQAKTKRRGSFSFFREDMNQAAQEKLALETALRRAIPAGELALHYQPQVDLNDQRLYGLEALARWRHPTLGNIPPDRFIAIAQECGLIGDLGKWAVNEACRQLGAWHRAGWAIPGISVNLSPTNFHDLTLPSMIAQALHTHQILPGSLTLEITEDVMLDANPSTLTTLHALHALGVRLSMDDFGTGYSSLGYLRRLPLNELKLDKSFVRDLERDHTNRALSTAVLHIGESLHLSVIAEGVETEEQRQTLLGIGYRAAQGYLFARPLPPAELEAWLAERN